MLCPPCPASPSFRRVILLGGHCFLEADGGGGGSRRQHKRGQHAWRCLLTIHLQDVGLEQLLVAGGVAGVVAHVDGGHLGDVQGVVLAEVLCRRRWWLRWGEDERKISPHTE